MEDEDKKKPVVEEPVKDKPTEKLSLVDEAKLIRDEILEAKKGLKEENDRKDKIQAEELLGSSAGGHIESKPKKETDAEYATKVAAGELNG